MLHPPVVSQIDCINGGCLENADLIGMAIGFAIIVGGIMLYLYLVTDGKGAIAEWLRSHDKDYQHNMRLKERRERYSPNDPKNL